jgi:hypothetical protein
MKSIVLNRFFWLVISFFLLTNAHSQVVYEPLFRDVYDYLSRLSQRGVIEYNDLIKPLPRSYIAEKLKELTARKDQLTPLEQKELTFYKKDFYTELENLAGRKPENRGVKLFGKDAGERWRLFSYRDKLFSINLSPILGYKTGLNDEEKNTHRWNGAYLYGYLGKHIGFSFDFRDNREEGLNINTSKAFTPVTGMTGRYYPESKALEYSETRATLAANWAWGHAAIGKDFIEWGYEENGKAVLSNKAPSYSFIRLDIYPVHWLRFNYFHGWLRSDVVDSTEIYKTQTGTDRILFREKYLASHTLTLTPLRGLDFSLGESIVYSDRLEFAYLIPIMFFRLADHYLSARENDAGNNAQLFAAVSSRNHIKNTHIYGTLFIDDLSVPNIFNKEKQVNHLGGTIGLSITDLPLNNLSATLEYSRINPFVYTHYIQTITYTSASYNLGHWIGNNGDVLYGSLKYGFLRGLRAKVWGQYIRKGEAGEVDDQYELPHKPFLFGLNTNFTYFGIDLRYEIIHELFLSGKFQHIKISEEQEGGSWINTNRPEFFVSLYYGL